jgi:hypothetical protein
MDQKMLSDFSAGKRHCQNSAWNIFYLALNPQSLEQHLAPSRNCSVTDCSIARLSFITQQNILQLFGYSEDEEYLLDFREETDLAWRPIFLPSWVQKKKRQFYDRVYVKVFGFCKA